MHVRGLIVVVVVVASASAETPWTRVLPEGQLTGDLRLTKMVALNDYFPFHPPKSIEEWQRRRDAIRRQILVSLGLWPLPEKTPLNPVVHGRIERDEYTVEKVFFASLPGHYVTGNLYRPKKANGKQPGVLCPHGHWANGRFYDAGETQAKKQIEIGAEKTIEGARYPLQARCAMLARMGCVVFHYDMVGVADSQQIGHTAGFTAENDERLKVETELWQQNFMGLQTWNSIRALDFLLSLDDVDPTRIGVTGASGGGTQTFILCALDDRPTVAFPAVMVSTAMQGGCICENASYLRIGTGNVEFAGLFAPKPLGMTAANDWTREMETKGLPELKALYGLYRAEDAVMVKYYPFEHNYNQVSRETMYNWFNKHLRLGYPEPIAEKPFQPIPPKELSVFDQDHPRPKDATGAEGVRRWFREQAEKSLAAVAPRDAETLAKFRDVVGTALRVMLGEPLASESLQTVSKQDTVISDGVVLERMILKPKLSGERIPLIALWPKNDKKSTKSILVWVHPKGKASLFQNRELLPVVRSLLKSDVAVFSPDVLGVGEQTPVTRSIDRRFVGYTLGYNRPLLAEQARDVMTTVSFAQQFVPKGAIHLVGWGTAGTYTILARAGLGEGLGRCAIDAADSRLEQIATTQDPRLLPGALRYGGLSSFAALCTPSELFVHNATESSWKTRTSRAYQAAGCTQAFRYQSERASEEEVLAWILR